MDAPAILLTKTRRRRADRSLAGAALGLGSMGIGLLGLVLPGLLARIMKVGRSTVWVIAVRDLASAWLILGPGGRIAYLTRAMFDFGDSLMMIRRRPAAAVLAAATAVVGLREGLNTGDAG